MASPPTVTPASAPTRMMTATSTTAASVTANSSTGYWMKDPYKYSYPRGYSAPDLHNFAWAQAVQNKPLTDVLFKQEEGLTTSRGGGGKEEKGASVNSNTIGLNENVCNAVNGDDSGGNNVVAIDNEREEGELEEGEIDLESEQENGSIIGGFNGTVMEDDELEDRVSSIRKVLENVNAAEAEKSFDVVCARLRSSVESLQQLVLRCWFPSKNALVQQSFTRFKCVNSVFSAMRSMEREQNRSAMTRLLTYVMTLQPAIFSPEQMKEIESMMISISLDGSQRSKAGNKQEELPVADKAILTDSNTLAVNMGYQSKSFKKFDPDPSVSAFDIDNTSKKVELYASDVKGENTSDVRLSNLSNMKCKPGTSLLLDVHRVHDIESLPSPTQKATLERPATHTVSIRNVVHPYENDALKAVTSYQQKFAHRTFLSNDRLPSPTPSEEGKVGECDDGNEEVSSSSAVPTVSQTVHQIVSSAQSTMSSAMQTLVTSDNAGLRSIVASPTSQATAKSRDPRLRFMNPDLNTVDVPAIKKQRTGREVVVTIAKKEQSVFGSTGLVVGPLLVNGVLSGTSVIDPRKVDNTAVCSAKDSIPMSSSRSAPVPIKASTSITSQSLLRDIAYNPAASMNFEKQRTSSEPSRAASDLANSSTLCSIPFSSVALANCSLICQKTGGLAEPSSVVQMDKPAKVHMKPRDPRRALHTSSAERSENSGSEPTKQNEVVTAAMHVLQKHVIATDTSPLPSRPTMLPDTIRHLMKNLKNIADIMSVSQEPALPALNSQGSSGEGQACLGANVTSGLPLTSGNQQEPCLMPEEGASGPARSWTPQRDVDHLFDGYDEQQKAAIQKERARRIEEQKKMFAARKLCLVLDLDHTLLNSAKFSEVDPIHHEILRKKEEQDREKPSRHLFCFPHMGMWTKLRPGIWNFLEKASKLYELHLYTMGNKLYATEMAKVLDPKGILFAGRVISRGDNGDLIAGDDRVPKTKDLEGVLGMESAVIIIDDSVRVWPHNKLNLIAVERYIYFPCSRRQFGLPGPSLLEIDHDERAEDGTLASSLSVVERIHAKFFSREHLDDVDVRNILAFEQQKILAGCRIVFSRVFPVGEVNPQLHPLWQTAEQFGAVCTNQIDEQVTHVVANSLGTDKVNWALSTGRFVVNPGWVEASALLYRRANELDFAIKV